MDSLSPALLVKAALTAAGHTMDEPERHVWSRLAALVVQPPDELAGAVPAPGQMELEALFAAPTSETRAEALADALTRRARRDPSFRRELEAWGQETRQRSHRDETLLDARAAAVQGSLVQAGAVTGVRFVTYGPGSRHSAT
ncbi:hypothetical protein ABZ656_44585 [Streptomyces sp. NPDC007095]|uniref:hypothetical protein n=1 Tax=Streptomyces sp. NPDC007095 TaxID=3154482 RepID=UPI0033DE1608